MPSVVIFVYFVRRVNSSQTAMGKYENFTSPQLICLKC